MKKLLSEVCTIQYGFPFDSANFQIVMECRLSESAMW